MAPLEYASSTDFKQNSIRRRYRNTAIVIATLLLASATTAQFYFSRNSAHTYGIIKAHERSLQLIYNIQTALARTETIVSDHMLSASNDSETAWNQQYEIISSRIRELSASKLLKNPDQVENITTLEQDLKTLNNLTVKLLTIRLDIDKQFPALYYARTFMLPMSQQFLDSSDQALEDLAYDKQSVDSKTLYSQIQQIRWMWLQMVTQFRMYKLNRLTSMSHVALDDQVSDIETYHTVLLNAIAAAEQKALNDKSGLETVPALRKMRDAAKRWNSDFQKVKRINSSIHWRTDRVMRSQQLQPVSLRISQGLATLVNHINANSVSTFAALNVAADDIIKTMWVLTVLGLVVIVLAYLYFDSRVLKPIAQVTEALHAEAIGDHHFRVPKANLSETQGLVHAFSYMRNQIQIRQSLLEHQALHDALTRLPNRYALETQLIDFLKNPDLISSITILILDLDRFKDVNDTLGHRVGDQVLEQAGQRILSTLRESDIIARWGGDEFAVVLPNSNQIQAVAIAEKISRSLAQVFNIEKKSLYIGVSIGIAVYPTHARNAESLLNCADLAMYYAKRKQLNFSIYSPDLHERYISPPKIIDGLALAIKNNKLDLLFQPIVAMPHKEIIGVEALLRWQHESHGSIAPQDIVAIAEHHNLSLELIRWVLTSAFQRITEFGAYHGDSINIAVNLSLNNLKDKNLLGVLQSTLTESSVAPQRLFIEIPEAALVIESPEVIDNLHNIHKLGAQLVIGDFGTGQASLSSLQRVPIAAIKIDKSLISTMATNESHAILVRSAINLAHNLGMKVIAIGIESANIWSLVEGLQSDQAQGFLISAPLRPEDYLAWAANY